eukprot:TRINITY_DN20911_c0_g1_i1.p1 TRINITY_DN20911_c0_g1~~TRINITY_DN20911_c0_g1_i1.p1  ORF type:complete len:296 (+),score=11.28 TRINITY_DN20911_c0_g1_i1:52-888(+)
MAGQCSTMLAATAEPHPFTWSQIENEPKVMRRCLSRGYRTMEYEILHTGGFVRLCTQRGRIYWLAQNEQDHRLPDWKLHFSVRPQHLPRAWDIISQLFLEVHCDFGMKAVAREAIESWPEKQRGRELTVYIFQHSACGYIGGGPMIDCFDKGSEHEYWLGPEFERPSEFWSTFIDEAEERLSAAGVESHRGVADGDLPLGRFTSIRNEAFVLEKPRLQRVKNPRDQNSVHTCMYVYPPNSLGWNASGHACPLRLPLLALCRQWLQEACRCPRRQDHED